MNVLSYIWLSVIGHSSSDFPNMPFFSQPLTHPDYISLTYIQTQLMISAKIMQLLFHYAFCFLFLCPRVYSSSEEASLY